MQSTSEALFQQLTDDELEALREQTASSHRPDLASGVWFDTLVSDSAAEVITAGWKAGDHKRLLLSLPVDWDALCQDDRSWGSQLHGWKFMDKPMQEFIRSGDRTYLQWCLDRAVSWSERYSDQDTANEIVWYNMALGQRSLRLAGLIYLGAKNGMTGPELRSLLAAVDRHRTELALDTSFNPRTNHGYFVAIGQTVLGAALDAVQQMRELAQEGRERLAVMVRTQFLPDGGHSEHSPEYHRMLMRSFQLAVDNGLIKDADFTGRLRKAADLLGWMIQPSGCLVPMGDTPNVNMVDGTHPLTLSPQTNFLMSGGKDGQACTAELGLFPDSGYAFVRSPQPDSGEKLCASSYVAFSAAFHGRAHKHADDLNFVWYDRGQEILVEGGRYGYGAQLPADSPLRADGYYYADPFRRFVESTPAHNTVTANGRNHDRRRAPVGSGLGMCEQADGKFFLRGRMDHSDWTHRRTIELEPGIGLTVIDDVQSTDAAKRDFQVWFNVAGALGLCNVPQGDQEELSWTSPAGDWKVTLLTESGNALPFPVRESEEPLRGWRSVQDGSREGVWSVRLEAQHTRHHVFRNVFRFQAT
ncbi:heparinase II/III domain-containing protein [Paenarthrobacter ureafaciens]|uniref:heparinase II/III domain-containing protein n=1 Tax=Paenarthrobacter ureafaciens TaxID=37931 RepID=UPI001C2C9DD7|nr:heparinase II/III family protein [Paenarthrobacter ureafaciens]UOD80476.1 heparinase II/III family protein [Paenarthrobacter ureafaciens]WNZ03127.1 heparinase II/III family protein [Paenarthrobacter ureafaciens]